MGNINMTRVIVGGLVAGFIINVGEFLVNGVVLEADWREAMKSLNRAGDFTGTQLAEFMGMGLVIGILTVGAYAAIRPRLGAGARTAAMAGLGMWIVGNLMPSIGYYVMGLFPNRLVAIGSGAGLVEMLIAAVAGAYFYKEAEAEAPRSTAAGAR